MALRCFDDCDDGDSKVAKRGCQESRFNISTPGAGEAGEDRVAFKLGWVGATVSMGSLSLARIPRDPQGRRI